MKRILLALTAALALATVGQACGTLHPAAGPSGSSRISRPAQVNDGIEAAQRADSPKVAELRADSRR